MEKISIIGAGLAGSEAAIFLARHGIKVDLYEMRPVKQTPAHHSGDFAELVCSNSLKSKNLDNACGLLKAEMSLFNSIVIESAYKHEVPGGNALTVDRELFSQEITRAINNEPNINVIKEEVKDIPNGIVIIASGPLTSESLTSSLEKLIGKNFLSFFDASAPIIEKDSIDFNVAYYKSRYDQGDDAYINCPFTKEQYDLFYNELINAKIAPLNEFDTKYFDACQPVEVIAKKGVNTLRFGPMKARGLKKDLNHRPYAVVQLRQDNVIASLYNLVGFQTNLTYAEQQRVFRLIPGLENASFVRFGLMHRNTYINAPSVLNSDMSIKANQNIYIAGQLSGVEGYVESAASGLYVALQIYLRLTNKQHVLPENTMLANLMYYLNHANPENFSPMNANFGIFKGAMKHNRLEVATVALEATKIFIKGLYE